MFLRLSCQHFPLPRWSRGSTHHIWCNRHLFSLKQHIPSANGLCLTQKYHYLPRGHCKSKHADCRFDPAQLLIARSLARGLGGIVRLLTVSTKELCTRHPLFSCASFLRKFIITPNISSVNKSFKKYFSQPFFLDFMRFCAVLCVSKK